MNKNIRILLQLERVLNVKNQSFVTKCHNLTFSPTISSSNYSIQNKNCWKCGAMRSSNYNIFCEKCNTIQMPSQDKNYFKILEVEESFNVDKRKLKEKFRKFQSLIHPDKYTNRSKEEQNISEEYSSLINKAYSNLSSPMKRAEHLLHLKGHNIEENQVADEPLFLMEIMKLNEEVEDVENDMDKLKRLNEKNMGVIERLMKDIDENFGNGDIEGAKKVIVKLKYYMSVSTRIHSIFREAGVTN